MILYDETVYTEKYHMKEKTQKGTKTTKTRFGCLGLVRRRVYVEDVYVTYLIIYVRTLWFRRKEL